MHILQDVISTAEQLGSYSEYHLAMRTSTLRPSTSFMSGVCLLVASVLGRVFIRQYQQRRRIRARQLDGHALPLSIVIKPAKPMAPRLPAQTEDLDTPPRGNPWMHEFQHQDNSSVSLEPAPGQPDLESSEPLHFHNLMPHLPAPSSFQAPSSAPDDIIRRERKIYRQGAHIKSVLEEQTPNGRWRRRMIVYANNGGGPELRGWGGQGCPRIGGPEAVDAHGYEQ